MNQSGQSTSRSSPDVSKLLRQNHRINRALLSEALQNPVQRSNAAVDHSCQLEQASIWEQDRWEGEGFQKIIIVIQFGQPNNFADAPPLRKYTRRHKANIAIPSAGVLDALRGVLRDALGDVVNKDAIKDDEVQPAG